MRYRNDEYSYLGYGEMLNACCPICGEPLYLYRVGGGLTAPDSTVRCLIHGEVLMSDPKQNDLLAYAGF